MRRKEAQIKELTEQLAQERRKAETHIAELVRSLCRIRINLYRLQPVDAQQEYHRVKQENEQHIAVMSRLQTDLETANESIKELQKVSSAC